MKINEISFGGWKGFGSGSTTAGSAEQKRIEGITNKALEKWTAYSQQLAISGATPSTQDVTNWFTSFSGVAPSVAPQTTNPAQLKPWLTQQIAGYLAKKTVKPQEPAPAVAPLTTTATTTSDEKTGVIGALGRRGSATPTTTPEPYSSPLGVTVAQASDAGITLKYKNRNFMLNNRGEWAMDGKDTAGATAGSQLQAEMDKVAKSTGYM